MLRSYKAIVTNDRLKWIEEKPPQLDEDRDVYVQVTVLDNKLPGSKQQEKTNTLVEFFRESPLYGSDIDLERDGDYGREVHL